MAPARGGRGRNARYIYCSPSPVSRPPPPPPSSSGGGVGAWAQAARAAGAAQRISRHSEPSPPGHASARRHTRAPATLARERPAP